MGIKELKKTVKKSIKDDFEDGTVIKWTSGGKYIYAVVKAGGNWWITGTANYYGKSVLSYEALVRILGEAQVTDVQIATEWTTI